MKEEKCKELIEAAMKARKEAYAPYSHFCVGAALLCRDGTVYTGCNVENASYPAANCAERTAVFKAVSEGKRQFAAIAVMGGPEEAKQLQECMPCGICRQVLAEFCSGGMVIITGVSPENYKEYTLEELLPHSFTGKNLQ
ncbi:MAG: cytidine deaminase [Ruminococcus sp.]|jgi:cytidine deaminase